MIITIGGIKGGSGKTTISTNLTVIRSSNAKKVLLVDADEQKSATAWAEQREAMKIPSNWTVIQLSGTSVNRQLQKLKDSYDDIIVDVGGRDTTSQRSALSVTDVFLIPFKPRAYDIWTISQVSSLILEVSAVNPKLKSIAVLNQTDAIGKDNDTAEQILKESNIFETCPFSLGNRKAFANASTQGLGVTELKTQDAKASQEIKDLYSYLYVGNI